MIRKIASKVNDKISKLAENIHQGSQDKYHRNYRDEDYRDKYKRSRDRQRNRYCDGHREERQRDYEETGTCKKMYQSPCRHYPRKSERDPRSCHDYTPSDYENLKADNRRLQNCADNAPALVDVFTKTLK